MIFLDLPEDVIYQVLCLSDIYSVLCISQTNKYLHDFALSPIIWRSLVEDLRKRNFLDRLSAADIRTMSTQSLMSVVRRLVVGPEAWAARRIQSLPTIQSPKTRVFSRILRNLTSTRGQQTADPPTVQACAQILLHPSIPPAVRAPHLTKFKVLRGGKYALFIHVRDALVLGCWRVVENSLLGTYNTRLSTPHISDFEAEVLPGGEQARIVMCILAGTDQLGFVEVMSWDFGTGATELLSTTACADYDLGSSPKISCSVAAVRVYQKWPRMEMCLIIDWRAQQYCKIFCPTSDHFPFFMDLIPGYLILTVTAASGTTQDIAVVSIASLADSWVPVGQQNINVVEPMLFSNIPPVGSNTFALKGVLLYPGLMAIYESPLEQGIYRVWLSIGDSIPGAPNSTPDRAMLCSLRLAVPKIGDSKFTWQIRSCTTGVLNVHAEEISYSGYTQGRIWSKGTHRVFPPDNHSPPIDIQMPGESRSAHLLPHGAALQYVTTQAVILRYFE
ncbi:hypothetical protein C8R44DRAFT_774116, partial [Mycena epipterygia]